MFQATSINLPLIAVIVPFTKAMIPDAKHLQCTKRHSQVK